jgi:thiamine biosynthesis lipoprotein
VPHHSIARDAITALHSASGSQPAVLTDRRPLMGGHATISLVGASAPLLDAAFALADRCEARWSRFLPTSDISRLNRAEGRTVDVDASTVRLIGAMREGVALTDGDFDPTLLPLVIEAGYAASTVAPDLVTVLPDSARAPGRLADIRVEGTGVTMPVCTTLDAGGIGKGLAADLVSEFALAEGAWGVMAELGGDIVVAGRAPDGVAWSLGVEDPFEPGRHLGTVRIARGAIVTSSQRKRRFPNAGGERHHLIDPRAGVSAGSGIQTTTVIAATGARAEALAKSGFLRPASECLAWLPTVGAAGLLVDADGTRHESTNWGRYA